MNKKKIALVKTEKFFYPQNDKRFRPSSRYPEYKLGELAEDENHIYDMVRQGFHMMNMDKDNYNSEKWNPLGGLIHPGNMVLLKPNLVMDENHIKENGTDCLYTQPSLVAAVVDYVLIALQGKGEIIVGDAPMQECNFERLIAESGYQDLIAWYQEKLQNTDIKISLVDFRGMRSKRIAGVNHSEETTSKGTIIDLGGESEFAQESEDYFERIRITNYDPSILKQHHNMEKHEYCVSNYILDADVIINMPKPKTHRKAGVTISLKNLVGINCRKEYLPHHANGSLKNGGDEYLDKNIYKKCLDKIYDKRNYYMQTSKEYKKAWFLGKVSCVFHELAKLGARDKFYEGNWYGNDTISKTIVDLNKILFYANKTGELCCEKQRKYFIVADMIISGEKEGPVAPSPKNVGIIAMGDDPVCFDEAIAEIMGAKQEYINTLKHARKCKGTLKLTESDNRPYLISNDEKWNEKYLEDIKAEDLLYFVPTSGWVKAFRTLEYDAMVSGGSAGKAT